MNTSHIRLLAITTMIVDHIGAFFYPDVEILRLIGRLSFPLFAWLIANGAYYTKNSYHYLLRLFLLAIMSQIPYALVANEPGNYFQSFNILFTLSLGLLAIICIQKTHTLIAGIGVIACAALAQFIGSEFGAFGVLSIVTFYLFFENKLYLAISQIVLVLAYFISSITWLPRDGTALNMNIAPVIGLISLLFIVLYNQKEGWKIGYLFYIVYPLQYAIIYLVRLLL